MCGFGENSWRRRLAQLAQHTHAWLSQRPGARGGGGGGGGGGSASAAKLTRHSFMALPQRVSIIFSFSWQRLMYQLKAFRRLKIMQPFGWLAGCGSNPAALA